MGKLLISCPNTGRNIFTGKHVDPLRFRKSAVFFGRTYCEHCEGVHEWFAKEAWVCMDCTEGQICECRSRDNQTEAA